MHAVMGSSDLVTLIIESIYVPTSAFPTDEEKEAHRCLSQCARVNKFWHNESCRFLWKGQINLATILRFLIPGDPLHNSTKWKRFKSKISLSRFFHYSKWICSLTCSDLKGCGGKRNLYLLAEDTTLFTRLETLLIDQIDGSWVTTVLALLRRTVKSITLSHPGPEDIVLRLILGSLEPKSISLSELKISHAETELQDYRHLLLECLIQQQSLSSLNLHPSCVDMHVLCAVASLPRLSTLGIWERSPSRCRLQLYEEDEAPQFPKREESWFSTLKNLGLAFDWIDVVQLLQSAFINTTGRLRTMELVLMFDSEELEYPHHGRIADFLPSSKNSLSNMQRVDISVGNRFGDSNPLLTGASLAPLSNCSQLRYLTVRPGRMPLMDDKELLALAKNWPQLLELHFVDIGWVSRNDRFRFSLCLIADILSICHELLSLSLTVSHSHQPLDAAQPKHKGLQTLNLGISFLFDSESPNWGEEAVLISAYLAAVTPPSCQIDFFSLSEGYDLGEGWRWGVEKDIPDDEWRTLVEAHEQTQASIRTHIRECSISGAHGIAAALSDDSPGMIFSS